MWAIISIVFLGSYCLMSYYIGRRGWTTLGKSASRINQKVYWGFLALLVFIFPATEIAGNFLPDTLGQFLTISGGYSMVAVAYIFLLILLIDFIRIIDKRVSFVPTAFKEHKKTPLALSALVIVSVIAVLAYGSWNARHPVVTGYDLAVSKNAGSLQQLKIVMVSDIHYGAVINAERLSSIIKTLNDLQPDIVLFAGDITEGVPGQEEAKRLANILGQVQAKYGKFAVPGNHDRGLRDESELSRCFKEAGINVLKDNYLKVADCFYVIGRDNLGYNNSQGRKELKDLMVGIDSSMPLILLDHQPVDLQKAQENGVDLQLSGHTHKGQIFPIHLITSKIYELDWGLLNKGNYNLIVSSGYGTWGPPLRVGSSPEVVSITMKFDN